MLDPFRKLGSSFAAEGGKATAIRVLGDALIACASAVFVWRSTTLIALALLSVCLVFWVLGRARRPRQVLGTQADGTEVTGRLFLVRSRAWRNTFYNSAVGLAVLAAFTVSWLAWTERAEAHAEDARRDQTIDETRELVEQQLVQVDELRDEKQRVEQENERLRVKLEQVLERMAVETTLDGLDPETQAEIERLREEADPEKQRAYLDAKLEESEDERVALLRERGNLEITDGSPAKAVVYFERALALTPADVESRMMLAFAHLKEGELEASLREVGQARQIVEPDEPGQLGFTFFIEGSALYHLGRREPAVVALEQAIEQLELADVPTFLAGSHFLHAYIHLETFELEVAKQGFLRARELCERTDARKDLALVHYMLGLVFKFEKDNEPAEREARASLAISAELDEEMDTAYARELLVEVLLQRLELEEAEQQARAALAWAEKGVDPELASELRVHLADIHVWRGEYEQAEELARAVIADRLERGDEGGAADAYWTLWGVLESAYDIGPYLESVNTAEPLLRKLGRIDELALQLSAVASQAEDRGIVEPALTVRRRSIAAYAEIDDAEEVATEYSFLWFYLIDLERHAEAAQALRDALPAHEAIGRPLEVANELGTLSDEVAELGQLELAEETCREAAAIFESAGETVELADELSRLGELQTLRGKDDEARASWARALALYEEVDGAEGVSYLTEKLAGTGD